MPKKPDSSILLNGAMIWNDDADDDVCDDGLRFDNGTRTKLADILGGLSGRCQKIGFPNS